MPTILLNFYVPANLVISEMVSLVAGCLPGFKDVSKKKVNDR